jgi:NADH-quinone oxidoreductase subunit N
MSPFLHDLVLTSPALILCGGVVALMLYDAWAKPRHEGKSGGMGISDALCLGTFVVALYALIALLKEGPVGHEAFHGLVYVDSLSWFACFVILFSAAMVTLLGFTRIAAEGVTFRSEYYLLLLIAVLGALVFATAAELITLFLGLETMSLGTYCLCGSALAKAGPPLKRSAEASLKYFLLGSFSSAFLLYGIALLYGLTGSTFITTIAERVASVNSGMLLFAVGLVLFGLAFKIALVPFHFWVPDAYQGSPTAVTAFMACVVKAAAVIATLRLFWSAFIPLIAFWSGALWLISVCTMVFGNLVALRQRSLKRMLAYSSIAHAGYMLMGFLAPGEHGEGGSAILYYLVAYIAMTMGSFGVVLAVTAEHGESPHPDDISRFNGLGYRRPILGALMALFMLSLAGIPPGMAGLMGKIYLFSAALKANYVGLAVVGVITAAISCYYYLRVIVAMYFVETEADEDVNVTPLGVSLLSALYLCALGVLVLGILPDWLHRGAVMVLENIG